jgi:hypothetical protein
MTEFEAMMLSIAIESPLAFAMVSLAGWPCRGPLHAAIAVMLATAVTHPQLWAASLWLYPQIGYWPTVGVTEALVILAEATIIAWVTGLSPARALVISGIANGASTLAGLALFA